MGRNYGERKRIEERDEQEEHRRLRNRRKCKLTKG